MDLGRMGRPFSYYRRNFVKIYYNRKYPPHVSLATRTTAGPPEQMDGSGHSTHPSGVHRDLLKLDSSQRPLAPDQFDINSILGRFGICCSL